MPTRLVEISIHIHANHVTKYISDSIAEKVVAAGKVGSPCKAYKHYTTAQASTTQSTGGTIITPVRHE